MAWTERLPEPFRTSFEGRTNLQNIVANTGWLIFDRVFRMGVGLVVGVWVARHLGPESFGLLNYAISLTAVIGSFATLGLDSIVVRELVKNERRRDDLLGTALGLRLLASVIVIALNLAATALITLPDPALRPLLVVIALGFVFNSFDVADYWFQAKIRSRYSVVAKNTAFFIVSAMKVAAILMGASVAVFATLATVEVALGAVGLITAYTVDGQAASRWRFRRSLAVELLRDSWPLTLSAVAVVTYMKIDQVMLGSMIDSTTVGIYAAAVKMVEVWYFVPSAITISVFPTIVQAKRTNEGLYLRRMQQLYDLVALLSIGLALIVTIFSQTIMLRMYGPEYLAGAGVLTLYVWSGVATFLGVASSQYLMAENLAHIAMYRTLLGMASNVILNLLLIPGYGMIGSAAATLISYFLATFGLVLFPQTRTHTMMLLRSLNVGRRLVRR